MVRPEGIEPPTFGFVVRDRLQRETTQPDKYLSTKGWHRSRCRGSLGPIRAGYRTNPAQDRQLGPARPLACPVSMRSILTVSGRGLAAIAIVAGGPQYVIIVAMVS